MTPLSQLVTGEWIATVNGVVVARGATLDEVLENLTQEQREDDSLLVEKVTRAGGLVL